MTYNQFLKSKVKLAQPMGFECAPGDCNPKLKDHQKLLVSWMVTGGRRACFAAFGLGKSVIQLETLRIILTQVHGRGLIVMPLGVRQEFRRDATELLGWKEAPKFIRTIEEAGETGIYLTNYETVRDGKLDPAHFVAASLDEAAVLRGFGGTKTFREFMRLFTGDAGPAQEMRGVEDRASSVKYRFVATATPSPNEYIELLAYADFLGVMDVSQAKTRFFKRDSTKADKLTLHPHKEREFWLWVSSWAIFVQRPEDLGCEGKEYVLPKLNVTWHEVPSNHKDAGFERNGQSKLFRDSCIGVSDAASEKRSSLNVRVEKLREIVAANRALPSMGELVDQMVVWSDLNDEQHAIEAALKEDKVSFSSVYGFMGPDEKEAELLRWIKKEVAVFLSKPIMHGAGANLQQSHTMVFLGIGFKFYQFIQAMHRIYRFLQLCDCEIHIIYSEAERGIRKELQRKWAQHNKLVEQMTAIIKEFGLSQVAMAQTLTRKMGVERVEITGANYTIVNEDSCKEVKRMADKSVQLILTSIPFSTQYEYTPNYADFGHSSGNEEFFAQMDYLTPQLLRVLEPGRICAIHVKDRIVPGGMTGLGFQTVYPFHCRAIEHFSTCPECRVRIAVAVSKGEKADPCHHRFAYMGMKTIVTDVVRENNQTYRLGWTEQCKDGTKMGVGMPEYLLLFRRPPTETKNSYADNPVRKRKSELLGYYCPECSAQFKNLDGVSKRVLASEASPSLHTCPKCSKATTMLQRWGNGPKTYSRSRWQIDAHGFARSDGNRLMTPQEISTLPHSDIFKIFRDYSLNQVYNFEHHVKIGEEIDAKGRLPVTFMLLQPQSWHDDVWTDITRMLTLNGAQSSKGKEMHLCPMQFDLADRVIQQFSQEGETVLDPFGGLMTVPYRAIKLKRKAYGIELGHSYFLDGATYCQAAERELNMPELFDVANLTEKP